MKDSVKLDWYRAALIELEAATGALKEALDVRPLDWPRIQTAEHLRDALMERFEEASEALLDKGCSN